MHGRVGGTGHPGRSDLSNHQRGVSLRREPSADRPATGPPRGTETIGPDERWSGAMEPFGGTPGRSQGIFRLRRHRGSQPAHGLPHFRGGRRGPERFGGRNRPGSRQPGNRRNCLSPRGGQSGRHPGRNICGQCVPFTPVGGEPGKKPRGRGQGSPSQAHRIDGEIRKDSLPAGHWCRNGLFETRADYPEACTGTQGPTNRKRCHGTSGRARPQPDTAVPLWIAASRL
mmetsp:Transcript_33036/g.78066  ORF Transcript_33036/g.78066 Transcript_33036/m.78066 type:complete len:228 (-) Transcript_33036:228-911(-)